jgi:hypothetical protein
LRASRRQDLIRCQIDQIRVQQPAVILGAQHEAAVRVGFLCAQPGREILTRGHGFLRAGVQSGLRGGVLHAGECVGQIVAEEGGSAVHVFQGDVDEHGRHVGQVLPRGGEDRGDGSLARNGIVEARGGGGEIACDQGIGAVCDERYVGIGIMAPLLDMFFFQQFAADFGCQDIAVVALRGGEAGRLQGRQLGQCGVQALDFGRMEGGRYRIHARIALVQAECGGRDRMGGGLGIQPVLDDGGVAGRGVCGVAGEQGGGEGDGFGQRLHGSSSRVRRSSSTTLRREANRPGPA